MSLDDESRELLAETQEIAQRRGSALCGTEHLLIAMLHQVRHIRVTAARLGRIADILDPVDYASGTSASQQPAMSPRLKQVLEQAIRDASSRGADRVEVPDISWALLQRTDSGAATWLREEAQIDQDELRSCLHGSGN